MDIIYQNSLSSKQEMLGIYFRQTFEKFKFFISITYNVFIITISTRLKMVSCNAVHCVFYTLVMYMNIVGLLSFPTLTCRCIAKLRLIIK